MSTILIGVDASERSEDAIAFGGRLAVASDAHVVVACAFPYSDMPSRAANASYRAALSDDAAQTAREMRDRLTGIGGDHSRITIVADCSPAHALHDVAQAEDAEIIVVGSSHTGHLGRVAPGSTAERLLHGAPCSVALVPRGYRTGADQPVRRIGVAYDGSDESAAALNAAVALARAFDAELEVIGVVTRKLDATSGAWGEQFSVEPTEDFERDDVQNRLDRVVSRVPRDVEARSVCLLGLPAEALAERSATLDLMVAGSRGYGPLRSVLVGGISGPLIRLAQCPLIIVPRGVQTPLETLFPTIAATAT